MRVYPVRGVKRALVRLAWWIWGSLKAVRNLLGRRQAGHTTHRVTVVCSACGCRYKIRIKGGAAVFLSFCPCGRLRGEKGEEERRKN